MLDRQLVTHFVMQLRRREILRWRCQEQMLIETCPAGSEADRELSRSVICAARILQSQYAGNDNALKAAAHAIKVRILRI